MNAPIPGSRPGKVGKNMIPFTGFPRCCSPIPVSVRQSRRQNLERSDVRPHGLSARKGWLDEQNRVFITFTLEEAMKDVLRPQAVALFPELDKVGDRTLEAGSGSPHKTLCQELHPEGGSLDFRKTDTIHTNKNHIDPSIDPAAEPPEVRPPAASALRRTGLDLLLNPTFWVHFSYAAQPGAWGTPQQAERLFLSIACNLNQEKSKISMKQPVPFCGMI